MNSALSRAALKLHERITGRHILARLEELNRTQWLSRDELLALQRDKLIRLVEYANKYVPYYRRVFEEVDFQPDDLRKDLTNLNKIPILTKAIIRKNWDGMLTTEPERRATLTRLSTSGSTGEPLIFMQDSNFRDAVTADVQRHLGWGGWKLGDVHAVIWGVNPQAGLRRRLRADLIDKVWNRYQSNAFAISDENWRRFTQQTLRKKPVVLFGYASAVHRFAQYVRQTNPGQIAFEAVFSSAEMLQPPVRKFIEETFGCKVFNRYGTLELGGLACECEAHTGMHISAENSYLEILLNGHPTKPGESGDIIVTNLNNFGMPFIRYSIGDAGAWLEESVCPCGRASPQLKTLQGRVKDAFVTQDGRIVYSGFSGHAFECLAHPAVRQFQVVQKSLDHILIRLETEGEIPGPILDEIRRTFQRIFGERVHIEFEFPDEIKPLPSGKHQYTVSELNKQSIEDNDGS